MQYTNEGDPAREGTEQKQNRHDAQIRAMQHRTSVQYTNQGDPAQEDTEQNKQNAQITAMQHRTQTDKTQCPDKGHAARRENRLKGKGKVTIRDGGNDSTGTPLTVEEATMASRLKSLKKDGQMESQTRLYPSGHRSSAGTNSTETEVITGLPDEIFTKVQQIHKNPGGDNQLVRAEAEENMTIKKSRTHERKTEQQRLEPGENTLSKGTVKEQMLQRLNRRPTKTRGGN